jgi:Cu-Zn family superoxide dismutase
MKRFWIGIALIFVSAAGGAAPPEHRVAGLAAELRDSAGTVVAHVRATQNAGGVRFRVTASRLPPGVHGIHIHAVGRCDAPAFAGAGPHWNPGGRQHGRLNPQGMHKGDLPNLVVGADGRGRLDATVAGASLGGEGAGGLLDADGSSVVIHASPDDERTDPSGNSGARIACAVLNY